LARAAQIFIQLLIVYSVVTLSLETVPELSKYQFFFHASETVVVVIFTIEYVIRWALADTKLRYPFRPLAIVDLLAILPFYVQLGFDLRSVRAVRLLRIFRLLKLGRYSRAMQNLGEAVRRAGPELVGFGLIVLVIIALSSMALSASRSRCGGPSSR
jgi:voltage-gated potassium channel